MFNLDKVPGWFWAVLAALVVIMVFNRASEGMENEQAKKMAGDMAGEDEALSDASESDSEEEKEVDSASEADSDSE